MPTVKEIAERSGVSPATVSRVMNGSGSVTAGKRERVLAVLEALGGTRPQRRSGSRSKQAAAILARLGYSNVYEFGGIMTWPYEVTAE